MNWENDKEEEEDERESVQIKKEGEERRRRKKKGKVFRENTVGVCVEVSGPWVGVK